ncbi:MAG: TIGR03088 family PEP-CTERM/XrtA system glycosyltransferase [Azonexus sp.]|jgi:sugar transferase (PEP-CTERM/EpsH1 system associated)|uniref:TIGR03088 family PEP-CTERM/XrtA system glycosyltransferase n=1 Tax=Azonexus sp. TaxID=1872668 RepID=UPI0028252B35|nr:TIGR03088 family PEP-CTERM/XrtA system glycosyltransferase [Azonexus sp.]MDR0775281.1 TIGR03088 family PEP-CTERM/XrtA system glycosyltransferase [Azonexus sp.]
MSADRRPLIAHVMYRFATGGLENGIVNLINHMPPERYRHAVIALTEVTDFRHRIQRDDVEFIALNKPPGQTLWLFPKLYRLFRRLRPAIVHSRNLAALEVQLPAWAAGVPVRIHGEHGRDVGDLDGSNVAYQRVRRFYKPFVSYYLALSRDLAQYLHGIIRVPPDKMLQVYNGVDTIRFHPAPDNDCATPGCPFPRAGHWLVGTVGRMQTVKDQPTLARAFVRALEIAPELRQRLRLVLIGDGPLRSECQAILAAAGIADLAWLPGERGDVPEVMRGLDCFVLPSLAEGISNTILEAMACGLPVIATNVGGNADLVAAGTSGKISGDIIPAADPETMAQAIVRFAAAPESSRAMGREGRRLAEEKFSMQAMVAAYQGTYDKLLHPSVLPRE